MSNNIKQIDIGDVHRLTSGQVIIDLTTAIKELIDNSIDAHASQIDILFKNYGVDSIECSDNGDGIIPQDYETLAKRHYTSKITTFEDVYNVHTMGFRGEALSSLCSIGKLVVITTQQAPKAARLEYDNLGQLLRKQIVSRNKGTTVQVTDLFNNLPVRRKEFIRTAKRQFNKTISLLQSYAMINDDVRMTVTNVTSNGKRSMILATQVSRGKPNSILQNVKSIFGSSCGNILDSVHLTLDLNPFKDQITKRFTRLYQNDDSTDHLTSFDSMDYKISIDGYISKNSFGCGRNSKDRQYIYINKRPIEYPTLMKCCNEIYRSFNNVQYPFVVLNFTIDPQLIDVNVTPDKRMILLHNEQYVIDVFKDELAKYYQGQALQLPKSNTSLVSSRLKKEAIIGSQELDFPFEDDEEEEEEEEERYNLKRNATIITPRSSKRLKSMDQVINVTLDEVEESSNNGSNQDAEEEGREGEEGETNENDKEELNQSEEDEINENEMDKPQERIKRWSITDYNYEKNDEEGDEEHSDTKESTILKIEIDGKEMDYKAKYSQETNELEFPSEKESADNHEDVAEYVEMGSVPSSPQRMEMNVKIPRPVTENDYDENIFHRSLSVDPDLKSHVHKDDEEILETTLKVDGITSKELLNLVRQTIEKNKTDTPMIKQEDDINDDVEYMNLTVNKTEFAQMDIIGQFNLGFIIVIRRSGDQYDLFIVDQHASDEKYNFETLQRETNIECQTLITPQPLELNIIEEFLILDNLPIFQSNGFKLRVDEDNEPGHKISLLSVPISKQTIFDINDFNELVQLVKENDGTHSKSHIKCSKIRSMFAMRACRMSIMIGKPLTHSTMKRVVHNLSGLDKPWNCPHGRPTMRHLMELKDWKSFNKDYEY